MKLPILLLFTIISLSLQAKVTMPHIFSDHMVLQRERPINVWGWAKPGEAVEVSFKGQQMKAKADPKGAWKVTLKASEHGGPYQMIIKGKENTITYDHILIGDVWLCSGQSNMEFRTKEFKYTDAEYMPADYPQIRFFTVQQNISDTPQKDLSGKWEMCSPATIREFSATGYFFGRELNDKTDIPIGLINSSWGGTDIEPWTSAEMMHTVPEFSDKMKELAHIDLKKEMEDVGVKEGWVNKPELFTSSMKVPQAWEAIEPDLNGRVWFRYGLELPADAENQAAVLSLGKIDDDDLTFVNGVEVGATMGFSQFRRYAIPENRLKKGTNTIVVMIKDQAGPGGFCDIAENMYLEVRGVKYSLAGTWDYVISSDSRSSDYREFGPNTYPTLLYNAMIAPIISYGIKGTIWYQGENNAPRAQQYQILFPNLINDWRSKWGYQFPFYWVQLANFMKPDSTPPVKSNWAELREAQTMTQSLPQTGQAVIIDIGDANDIHPRNKQDVGKRLAYHALNKDYAMKEIACTSPSFKSMTIKDGKAVIEFENVGSGLISKNKYGYVTAFAVAGADNTFYWAHAYIEGTNKVIVSCDKVANPVAVRYAWGNNPDDVNLYSSDGLPACPFRTDRSSGGR